jgi:methylglutaconyl-CoA hydratase
VRVGVIPAIISAVCVPKMGRAGALEAFLRGNRFPAATAVELGLLNHAVPAHRLDEAVAEVVADLRLGAPGALHGAKQLVDLVPTMALDEALPALAAMSQRWFASAEAAEGMAAFQQKRPPSWADGA